MCSKLHLDCVIFFHIFLRNPLGIADNPIGNIIFNVKPAAKRRLFIFIIVLAGLVVAGTVPMPFTISAPCIVQPSAVWNLARDGAGQIASGWEHNLLDCGVSQLLIQFDRPDFVEVAVSPDLREGSMVRSGDTVAVIESHEGLGQSRILETRLRAAEIELDRLLAGARREDIEVARQRVERARVAVDAFQPELKRVREQHRTGVVSLSVLQEAEGRSNLLETELRLAEAKLTAMTADARPEDLSLARIKVERLRESLESLRYVTGKSRPVLAPIDGKVRLGGSEGVMLEIERQDTLAVITILPESTVDFLEEDQPLEIILTSMSSTVIPGTLQKIEYVNSGQPGQYQGPCGITLIANSDGRYRSGMTGRTRFKTVSRTLLSVILERFKPAGRGGWR